MFCRTAVTLTYGDHVRRAFPAAMKAVGPRKGQSVGKYLGKVHKLIAAKYAKLTPAAKKTATKKGK